LAQLERERLASLTVGAIEMPVPLLVNGHPGITNQLIVTLSIRIQQFNTIPAFFAPFLA
jgi:hypothetical protein